MVDRRIVPALTVAAVVWLAAYLAAVAVWWDAVFEEAPASSAAVPGEEGPPRVYYRVTTPEGEAHILPVAPAQTWQAPLLAEEQFGPGCSLETLDATTARAALAADHAGGTGGLSVAALVPLLLMLLLPASLLLAASRVRARMATQDAIWATLSKTLSATGRSLMLQSGLGPQGLHKALDELNVARGLELRWDRGRDEVKDARLSRLVLDVTHCPRCNEGVRARFTADLRNVPECGRCLAPLTGKQSEQQLETIVARLREPPPDAEEPTSSFSLALFVLWSLLFPPIAAGYALRAARPQLPG